ncbi:excisionase family DNA binding protein [Micromonospora sp. A200]|uniref:helix-turn-helix domain-containing protein n=1 Tax=Micromonospora sp. A200 TaxID=2940568 RepID=UPI002475B2F7|nr:helix-turn-helix domain-containing protein [Micromonospora sp. A200]MDH6460886.1 excisionase family DNA binding protein [Micromonospora sp. A200]
MTGREWRPPAAYVHGLDGPTVVVPARVAAWLERTGNLWELRTRHRGADPEVDSVLVALATAAAIWRQQAGISSDHGTDQRKQPETETGSPLTTTQAAHRLGITDRGVRAAIAAQRLNAQRVGDQWLIDREDLEHFRAGRAA